jgi:cytochrome c oxidase accessory protein FixG
MWIERMIEGDANHRRRRDAQPWGIDKLWRKTTKHALWLLVAFSTGGAWILYYVDAPSLVHEFLHGEAEVATYFFIGLFTATTYLLAGWAREQVCTFMCPWPRFQSAMFDDQTLAVSYRSWRGESRGRHKAGDSWNGRGDCVDCYRCVAVCPTGIDIRDGIQLECIGCGLCVDACNNVMKKVGRPKNLIFWDTATRLAAATKGEMLTYRLFRPRTLMYATLVSVVLIILGTATLIRTRVDLSIERDRTPNYVTLSNGAIRNGYTVRIENRTMNPARYEVRVGGLKGETLRIGTEGPNLEWLDVQPNQVATFRMFVQAPRDILQAATTPIHFELIDSEHSRRVEGTTVFEGPETRDHPRIN